MPSLHSLFIQKQQPLSSSLFPVAKKSSKRISHLPGDCCHVFRRRKAYPFPSAAFSSSSCIAQAKERDSQQFEVDPDKARQALQDLDQQLESFSKKQVSPLRTKDPDLKFARNQMREEMPEISESFLTNSAVVLLFFSIFYNVLFYAVIKPAIDGPENIGISSESESTEPEVMQQLPLSSVLTSFPLLD